MELHVARSFIKNNWEAERSIYYTDVDSGKLREIDVFCKQTFVEPKLVSGTGRPVINLTVICECKSLSSSNVILSAGAVPFLSRDGSISYWLGDSPQLDEIVSRISGEARVVEPSSLHALHTYVVDRAYPHEGRSIRHIVKMPPPPVDLVARAFRETKAGELSDGEDSRPGPVWNAIRSSLSAVEAAKHRDGQASLGWVHGAAIARDGVEHFLKMTPFFLDAELMRFSYYHPFVTVSARLWSLEDNSIKEIGSSRLYISSIDGSHVYVDIVNNQFYGGIR